MTLTGKSRAFDPAFVGIFAVVIWGVALPIMRIIAGEIGLLAMVGAIFAGAGTIGLLNQLLRGAMPDREVFKNPYLYGRWLFFCMHEACICSSILIVQKTNVPFVILLNYIWPTAIIICSILFAGVRITRWPAFAAGSAIVLLSLSIEILQPETTLAGLFALPSDRLAYLLAFIGALSWGLYSAFTSRAGAQTGGGSVVPFFQLTLALGLPLSFWPGMAHWAGLTPILAFSMAGWCLVQFFAYICWDFGMRRGSVVVLSLCADFIPWLSLAAAHLFLGVAVGPRTAISVVMLVAGAIVTRYGTMKKRLVPEDEPPVV